MRYIKYILFTLLVYFSSVYSCYALVNTYTRTSDNLLIPDWIKVSDEQINDVLNTPAVSTSEKIYDFNDLLSDSDREKLLKDIRNYIDISGLDVAIVLTKDLRGFSIRDYSYNFYDYNLFKKEGIVFVIYVGGMEPEIFMGNIGSSKSIVHKLYTDSRINQTLKYVYKDIKNGNYYQACDNYIKILDGFYKLDNPDDYVISEDGSIVKRIPWLEIIILSLSLTFVITVLLLYRLNHNNTLINNNFLDSRLDNNTLIVKLEKDELVDISLLPKK